MTLITAQHEGTKTQVRKDGVPFIIDGTYKLHAAEGLKSPLAGRWPGQVYQLPTTQGKS